MFRLQDFDAAMAPKGSKPPDCYTRVTQVQHGRVSASAASLTKLFQTKHKSNSSVSDLRVEFEEGKAAISGNVHKGISIPFKIEGPVSTDGQSIRLRGTGVKAVGLPIKGLLDMVGAELSGIVGDASMRGVRVEGDSLYFRPEAFGNISGHLLAAKVNADSLVVEFGAAKSPEQRHARMRSGDDAAQSEKKDKPQHKRAIK